MMGKILRRIFRVLDERILRTLPGRTSQRLRIIVLRAAGAKIGRNVILAQGVRVIGPECLQIADDASVARDSVLDARGGLLLQQGALIGFESIILTSTHNSEVIGQPVHSQGMFKKEVTIGPYTWIGARCIVQPGVKIGANVIVGSSAVVTKDLLDGAIYAGIPARYIRDR